MIIPLIYNIRSLRVRWSSKLTTLLGISGSAGIFVAMLSLAHGFQATLLRSGLTNNAILRRSGSTSEVDSIIPVDQEKIIENLPAVARKGHRQLVSPEVVLMATLPLKTTGTDANVQLRGVDDRALVVHSTVRIVSGRFFRPGLHELVVGKNAVQSFAGLQLNAAVRFIGATWSVVGVFDSGGTAFDSEVWGDAEMLNAAFQRAANLFSSVTVRLVSQDALDSLEAAVELDPRLNLVVEREVDYYDKQSRVLTTLIRVLGSLVAVTMGVGAVFGALNTMYSAVRERSREIAVLRALGFSGSAIVGSFVAEAAIISAAGGMLGCLAVLPINHMTTGAMNWQTLSHLAFAFEVTPAALALGIAFAVLIGISGGLPPAVAAARRSIAVTLRSL